MNWTQSIAGTKNLPAWDSEGGDFRIVDCRSMRPRRGYRLMSFIHEDDNGDPKFWDFATEAEAKEYAERI